eukprot:CAMPEP_0170650304 /NCGR_PEP_ID=MMETSP0224-20130122/45735_1 /TAXON_ID=285029 /ORGANISM="Togula jolla, Strain CCCM 725" /LENGTH=30 /DNA_ID= /DNA_START= /DNA_END= /DNA_ORIENTATION=
MRRADVDVFNRVQAEVDALDGSEGLPIDVA